MMAKVERVDKLRILPGLFCGELIQQHKQLHISSGREKCKFEP